MKQIAKSVLLILCLAASVTACGDDDDDAATTSTTTEPSTAEPSTAEPSPSESSTTTAAAPVLEDAVRQYTDAFLGGEPEQAYDLLSERCRNETARNEFADIVSQATEIYGDEEIVSYEDDVDGNVATATYELSDPVLNQTQERWVLEDGGWHNDEC